MPHRIIGTILQLCAILAFIFSVVNLLAPLYALVSSTPHSNHLKIDVTDYVLPFALWFLGSELKRNSDGARKATRATLNYLSIAGIASLIYALSTGILNELGTWTAAGYILIVLLIVVPFFAARSLNRRTY